MTAMIPVAIVALTLFCGWRKGVDMPSCFAQGVGKAIKVLLNIFPNILIMMTAISVFRGAGGVELMSRLVSPLFSLLGLPYETVQIVFLRPFSGSGALALGREIMQEVGVESEVGKIAAVMLGASETSIYTIGVYSGFIGMKKTGRLIACALLADLAAFIAAVWCVRLLG